MWITVCFGSTLHAPTCPWAVNSTRFQVQLLTSESPEHIWSNALPVDHTCYNSGLLAHATTIGILYTSSALNVRASVYFSIIDISAHN